MPYQGSRRNLVNETGVQGIVHHVVSVRDLRAENPMRLPMGGCNNVLLYIGFPCLISIDGEDLVQHGQTIERGASPASYIAVKQGVYRLKRYVENIFLALPPGLGGTGDGEIYGLHGLVRVEGTFGPDLEPVALEPTLLALPTHSIRKNGILAHTLGTETTTEITIANNDWGQGSLYLGAHTPAEVWVADLSWRITQGGILDYPTTVITVAECGFYSFDGPVGNVESILRFKNDGFFGVRSFSPPYHLSLKDVFDATGGVNGGMRFWVNHTPYPIVDADITIEFLMNFWYRH